MGLLPKMIRDSFPDAEVYGTEWADNFKKHAYYEYNVLLTDDIDTTKKYDLISSYHVAEHQCDFDKELKRYVDCLKDDGYIYLSTPTWFHTMHNVSIAGWDTDQHLGIEYYYHPDHLNVWSRNHLRFLIASAGLIIEKENLWYYDDTLLLRKPRAGETITMPELEGPSVIKKQMNKIKKASDYFIDGKFNEALKVFPSFPKAWVMGYETQRKELHEKGFDYIENNWLKPATEACPNISEVFSFAADICKRYEQFEKSVWYIEQALHRKPKAPAYIHALGICLLLWALKGTELDRKQKCLLDARNLFQFLANTSIEFFSEAQSLIMQCHAHFPLIDENNKIITKE
jgi:SAM-dependent methyltransferase